MTTLTLPMAKDDPSPIAPPHPDSPIESLVEALRRREDGALEHLIKKTEKACYHLAYSILKDRELSKDALQDAYFLVYRRIGQLREPAAFKGWLYRIVSSCCHDILRKRSREIETDMGDKDDLLTEAAPAGSIVEPAAKVTDQAVLRQTFHNLAEIDREALTLREVCHLSYDEMSRVLQVPVGTVRSRLAKARKRFINAFRKEQNA